MIVAVSAGMSSRSRIPSTRTARVFLDSLRAGDIEGAEKLFGDNTCECPPKGGYITLLKYESGYVPNLAFLTDHNFQQGQFKVKPLQDNAGAIFPWEIPESRLAVTKITFDRKDMPYFLPLDMAYGLAISESKLEEFCKDPSSDGIKGFSLRLRPSLEPGFIKATRPTEDYYLMPEDVRRYLHPKDPGPVISDNDSKIPAEKTARMLPRLKSVDLYLTMVRRGQLKRWTIKEARFGNAVLLSKDGKKTKLLTRAKT